MIHWGRAVPVLGAMHSSSLSHFGVHAQDEHASAGVAPPRELKQRRSAPFAGMTQSSYGLLSPASSPLSVAGPSVEADPPDVGRSIPVVSESPTALVEPLSESTLALGPQPESMPQQRAAARLWRKLHMRDYTSSSR